MLERKQCVKMEEERFISYNHVFESVFGQPAVQEHGDEQVSEGGQNHLSAKKITIIYLCSQNTAFSMLFRSVE